MPQERLQKILAAAGIASRRKAEELISSGHVEVNGQVVTELGTKADPRKDHIRVNGKLLAGPERPVYLMLHKPKGYVTTVTDPEGRPTVMDIVRGVQERVFPVGRLDYLSEGLLLLTNDGELMQKLTHASSHVPKTYEVKVSGRPAEELIDKLRAGILLPPEPTRAGTRGGTQEGMKRRSESVRTQPAQIELSKDQENPWYEVTLTEGRNRQIRRMFEEIGHHVEKIKRVRYGTLELDIEPGQWRALSPKEVSRLRASIGKPFVIEPPRRRPQAPPPVERRELSAYDIRGLRDRAQAEGSEKPKRPMRQSGPRPPRGEFDKKSFGAPRPPASRDRKSGGQRPPSFGERGRFPEKRRESSGERGDFPRRDSERNRFERGRSEGRTGRMRDDRERRERPRLEGQRPQSDRPPRFDRERPAARSDRPPRFERGEGRPERPKRIEFDRPRGESKGTRGAGPRGPRPSFDRPRGERPDGPRGPRTDRSRFDREGRPERPNRFGGDRPRGDRPPTRSDRPQGSRNPRGERPSFGRTDRPRGPRQPGGGSGKFGKGPKRGNDRPGKRNR